MSTLRLDTIQDQAGGNASTPDEIYSGRAKAWVNFDGTFGTSPFTVGNGIRASFNVSSVTDNDTGKYTVNFSNSFSDANYAVTLSVGNDSGNSGNGSWITRNEGNGTGACGPFWFSRPDTNAQVDASVIGIAVFR